MFEFPREEDVQYGDHKIKIAVEKQGNNLLGKGEFLGQSFEIEDGGYGLGHLKNLIRVRMGKILDSQKQK